MTLSLEQLSARMRQGEDIPLSDTARIALALSIPSILEQLVVTAMEYIDAAMVGHIGAEATAAIGIVSSSTWLLHGILVGLYTAFSIQIAQYLGADRQQDARGVLRQSMLFNLILGLGAAAFGVGISRFLPGWLGADISLQADASAYFAIWSAALPFTMAMGMYSAMLRATGDALTPGLISVLVCALDVVFNFFLINPTRQLVLFGQSVTVWGVGLAVPGAALGTALSTVVGGLLALGVLLLRDGPLCIRKPGSWRITSTCLRNLWRVGTPLAAERAALSSAQVLLVRIVSGLGTVAIAANSLGVSAEGLCYMAGYGIQDASIALIGQAVGAHRRDMAKRFAWLCHDGHGHHGPVGHGALALCPGPHGHLHGRCRRHRAGCAGPPHRGLRRADVRGQHRSKRRDAGRRRQHRLLCAEPVQHVGRPAHPRLPAGSPAGPRGRLGRHVHRALHPGYAVPHSACKGQVAR